MIEQLMLESTFQDLGKHEDTLWRSVANREMTVAFFKKYRLAQVGYRTLDVGCGAGATVKFFNSEYQAYGMDNSLVALSLSRQRGLRKIFLGDMRNFPVKSDSFDFISAIDVIEHIDHVEKTYCELFRVCKKGGLILTIIPAFNFLWSERDERLGHQKRYTVKEIKTLTQNAGFTILKCTYINLFYFLPFLLLVSWRKSFHKIPRIKTDVPVFPPLLNLVLLKLLQLETLLLKQFNFPIGVSTLCVARK